MKDNIKTITYILAFIWLVLVYSLSYGYDSRVLTAMIERQTVLEKRVWELETSQNWYKLEEAKGIRKDLKELKEAIEEERGR